jgi:hypothetical protein
MTKLLPTGRSNLRPRRPIKEALDTVKDVIAVGTSTWERGPVRVDFERLDDGEAAELVRLVDAAATGIGFDQTKLGKKDAARFEALVEKSSALGDGYFERTRESARQRSELAALAREAAKPVQPSVAEQVRILRLLHEHVKRGVLHLDRVAVFVYLAGQILAAEPVAPGSRLEGAGDTLALVLSRNLGLGADHDPYGQLSRWPQAVAQLARVGYLEVEEAGPEMKVRLGRLALAALGRRPFPKRRGIRRAA